MEKYTIYANNPTMVLRDDGASIPMDKDNPDYQAYLEWVGKGNKPVMLESYVKPVEARWGNVRAERDTRLKACDWTQLSDTALTADEKEAWRVYRQELRDIPQKYADPDNVVFPTLPKGKMG